MQFKSVRDFLVLYVDFSFPKCLLCVREKDFVVESLGLFTAGVRCTHMGWDYWWQHFFVPLLMRVSFALTFDKFKQFYFK